MSHEGTKKKGSRQLKYIHCVAAAATFLVDVTAYGQDRVSSPYAFCGAEEAQRSYSSNQSVEQIRAKAAKKCEPLLERNIDNSIVAIFKEAAASGKPLPDRARVDLRPILRTKFRNAFDVLVQNNVMILRQRAGK